MHACPGSATTNSTSASGSRRREWRPINYPSRIAVENGVRRVGVKVAQKPAVKRLPYHRPTGEKTAEGSVEAIGLSIQTDVNAAILSAPSTRQRKQLFGRWDGWPASSDAGCRLSVYICGPRCIRTGIMYRRHPCLPARRRPALQPGRFGQATLRSRESPTRSIPTSWSICVARPWTSPNCPGSHEPVQ